MSFSFPSIMEEEEGERSGEQEHVRTGVKDNWSSEAEKGPVESLCIDVVKDLASNAPPYSTGNGTQAHGHLLATGRHSWGYSCRSRNSILLDILGDSSGSESEQPVTRRTMWRKTQSLHSVSSSEEGGVLGLLGARNEMDAEDMLISLGFCDFDSPQLIPDRLIPDSVAHARPSVMAQETADEEPPLCLVEPTKEIPEELELSLPLGATAEDVCSQGVAQQVKGRVKSTLPIPMSALPDTPYYPFYGKPLDTVMEETDSQLSPIGSPKLSIDHTSDSKPATGNLLSVPPLHRPSLPGMAPSREGYKVSLELPGRDILKLGMESASRDARRLSMDSHHSFQSADTIYFSVTSYDDAPEPPGGGGGGGGGVEGSSARSRSGSRSPSPRTRRKAMATPPPPTTVFMWLNSQVDEDITEVDQPWPFSELMSQEREEDAGSTEGRCLDLNLLAPDKEVSALLLTPSDSTGSFITCRTDWSSPSGAADGSSASGSAVGASLTHRFSQASTVVGGEEGSGLCQVSSASTVTQSSSLHRLSLDSSVTMVTTSHNGSPHREPSATRRMSLHSSERCKTPPPNVVGVDDACPPSMSVRAPSPLEAESDKWGCQEPMPSAVELQLVQTSASPTSDSPTAPPEQRCTPRADTPTNRQDVANCMLPNQATAPPHQSEVLAGATVTLPSGTAWDHSSQVLGSSCVVRTALRSPSPHRQPPGRVEKPPPTEEHSQVSSHQSMPPLRVTSATHY